MALIARSRVEDFLYHEAHLMDENRYEEWLALWTEDCRYWIPSNADEIDPSHSTSSSVCSELQYLSQRSQDQANARLLS